MADFRSFKIRLVCKTMPTIPLEEGILDVGMQDKTQTVHAGKKQKDGSMFFECDLEASLNESNGMLIFRGPFVHGTPQTRFLYLSWKRKVASSSLWYWRVKIPLSGITWDDVLLLKANEVMEADITDRRPHAVNPIYWRRRRMDAG
jgi:hypothetical protein